jgi:hypothetical protein
MWHFSFCLGLLLRRREQVQAEMDFLGFEAFTRPTEWNDATAASPAGTAGPRSSSSSGERVPRAA